MYLHSLSFVLLFLPLVVAGYWLSTLRGAGAQSKAFLLLASLAFYAISSFSTLPVLVGSFLLNHLVARHLRPGRLFRKRWLIFGLTANVVLLGAFKYTPFLAEILAGITGWKIKVSAIALPLGISFFTIQQIMYLVDCYEEVVRPAPALDHAVLISFFPYVTAGPIVRSGKLLPQLDSARPASDRLPSALVLFVIGLAKKVILAETFGQVADAGFTNVPVLGVAEGIATALAFTFQLYFDFSGYSDMAVAVGRMLGLALPENFDSPLIAKTVIDFWKRWHITLSNFITTYLYTPMAQAVMPLKFHKAMIITVVAMTIAGLWHGAAWTFVVFGALHGLAMVVNHLWKKTRRKLPGPLAWLLTFVFVVAAFVVFRSGSLHEARLVLGSMVGANGLHGKNPAAFAGFNRLEQAQMAIVAAVGVIAAFFGPNSNEIAKGFHPSKRWSLGMAALIVLCLGFMNASATKGFIYRGF
jgi:D-alanyl-lipoteichoic acid acyltransferase DltB (MBOAT superfamily)